MKLPNVLVDRVPTKEYHGKGRAFSPHSLFLGHCQSITKASRKVTNGRRGGAGRRQGKQKLRSRSLLPLAQHKNTFPITVTVTFLHTEKSAPMEGTQHRKELGIPHYQTKENKKKKTRKRKRYLTSIFVYFDLAHCLWGLSRTTPISFISKLLTNCGVVGPRAHTHLSPAQDVWVYVRRHESGFRECR